MIIRGPLPPGLSIQGWGTGGVWWPAFGGAFSVAHCRARRWMSTGEGAVVGAQGVGGGRGTVDSGIWATQVFVQGWGPGMRARDQEQGWSQGSQAVRGETPVQRCVL